MTYININRKFEHMRFCRQCFVNDFCFFGRPALVFKLLGNNLRLHMQVQLFILVKIMKIHDIGSNVIL